MKMQISTPWGSETPERITMKLGMQVRSSSGNGRISTHADSYVHTPRDIPRTSHLYGTNRPARGPRGFVRFWAFGVAKFTKNCHYLPWTPMNRRAKFDAASFIFGEEIRNRTNKQSQTVTDI